MSKTHSDGRRMRIERGRVMHLVEETHGGWLRSKCRRPHPVKGVSGTLPRAEAPAANWTDKRLWYPDCKHCPTYPDTTGETENREHPVTNDTTNTTGDTP